MFVGSKAFSGEILQYVILILLHFILYLDTLIGSRRGSIERPAILPNFNPFDFMGWGYLKLFI